MKRFVWSIGVCAAVVVLAPVRAMTAQGVTTAAVAGVVTADLRFVLARASVELAPVTVTATTNPVFSAERTGAATTIASTQIGHLPTINRRVEDLLRLTPQYSPMSFGFSFAGQDNHLNNMTIDGSYFNNSFGLAGQPGDRTGVAPVSLDALEQVQVNVA